MKIRLHPTNKRSLMPSVQTGASCIQKRLICIAIGAALLSTQACSPISRRAGVFQPRTPGYSYQDGIVTHEGHPELRVDQTDVDAYTTSYAVRSADGTPQAQVTFASSYEGTLEVRADFGAIQRHYVARIAVVPFTDLLASYIDNQVLVNGRLNLEGLNAYAASRGIALVDTKAQTSRLIAASHRDDCKKCVQDFRACQVNESTARRFPKRGLSVSSSCETKFQGCSQGGILTRPSEWPCGQAPE
jgi:hypothetical protein